ncbi:MAG: endonuclease [Bacteroidota bacterium]
MPMSVRSLALAAIVCLAAPALAQGPPQEVLYPGLTGTDLRDAVRADYAPSQTLGYNVARDVLFQWEQDTYGRLRGVYTGMEIVLAPGADPSSDAFSKGINTEHTVPRSQGSTGMAESDMHHLYPTRVEANSARGNSPFGEIPDASTDEWFRGTTSQSGIPTSNIDEWSEATSSAFEPREDHEGNAARAVFYHAAVYTTMPTSFFDAQKDDLLRWHYLDPADQPEADRSDFIATQQGTLNPFVRDSTLARRIWGDPTGGCGDCGGTPPPPPPPGPASGEIWVNEIHYDNGGGDVNEGVEIAGAAGIDLAGASLVLYNGSTQSVYDTIALSGTLPDQQAGFGTAWFAAPGLQNGAPDGLALVSASGDVLQFLSWEGTFTASGGAADGLTSTDIGVSESSGTQVGESLQLVGTGSEAGDFGWTGPQDDSPGQPNTGQTFEATTPPPPPPPAGPQAWINEIHYDNEGSDRREGIEIAGVAGTDITGWRIVMYLRDTGVHRSTLLSGVIPDEGNGYGAIWFKIKRLKNNRHGLALVHDGDVKEFISYEGPLLAVNGPAEGMTSIAIEPREGIGTTKDQSIQRLGGGEPDAAWTGPVEQSQGLLNVGQVIGSATAAPAPEAPAALAVASGEARMTVAPNPVRTQARIALGASGERVRVEVFSALGRRVALLHDGPAPEAVTWDAASVAPGVYVVRVASASGVDAVRVTVAR